MADFINPYNFVPLCEKKSKAEKNKPEVKNFTGVIQYQLWTKTPLFIPNTSSEHAFRRFVSERVFSKINEREIERNIRKKTKESECKSYDFYSYTDLSYIELKTSNSISEDPEPQIPVIPGSEVRGMFRNIYEILTNSCLSSIDLDTILSKRTAQTFSPGLLKKNGDGTYQLYEAEDCLYRERDHNGNWKKAYITNAVTEGQHVWFHREERDDCKDLAVEYSTCQTDTCNEDGYIVKGERSPRGENEKHCLHIFMVKKERRESIYIKNVEILNKVLKSYSDNSGKAAYREYIKQWDAFQNSSEETFFPVYYDQCETEIFLAPACITREVYQNTIRNIIRDYKPCEKEEGLCPACSLFGMLDKNFKLASRIRFSDLTLEEKDSQKKPKELYCDIVTLKELASPKINNIEFYLKRPEGAGYFWTYDYYIEGGVNDQRKVKIYTPVINGRKIYWHNMNPDYSCEGAVSKRNVTVRPLCSNVTFKGKLFFKNLSEDELQRLIYILNAGEMDGQELRDRKHGYKLGQGKPLGLGSVACKVTDVILREVSIGKTIQIDQKIYDISRYSSEKRESLFDSESRKHFLDFTKFDLLENERVCYPCINGRREIYRWFAWNHAHIDENGIISGGMTNNRLDMVYREYMKAMQPKLCPTENSSLKLEQGMAYEGIVTKREGKKVKFKIEIGSEPGYFEINLERRQASVFSKGDKIRVVYEGETEGKWNWKLAEG